LLVSKTDSISTDSVICRLLFCSLLHAFVLERRSRSELLGAREAVLQTCLRLFKRMKGEGLEPDSVTYTILMTIFGAAAQPELAWGVYQELRQKAQEDGSGVVLSQRQYGAILAVSCSWKAVEGVARLQVISISGNSIVGCGFGRLVAHLWQFRGCRVRSK
jgi:pentatricopeptide repeat protein